MRDTAANYSTPLGILVTETVATALAINGHNGTPLRSHQIELDSGAIVSFGFGEKVVVHLDLGSNPDDEEFSREFDYYHAPEHIARWVANHIPEEPPCP